MNIPSIEKSALISNDKEFIIEMKARCIECVPIHFDPYKHLLDNT